MTDLQAILEAAVKAGRAPGLVAAAVTPGGERLGGCAGARGADDAHPMTPDTIFMLASCTKAVTSVAAMQLVERGVLDLDAPVDERLPALASSRVLTGFDDKGGPLTRPARRRITLRHLLTHTSGLAYDFCSADLSAWLAATGGVLMGAVTEPDIPLLFDPGEGWQYGIGIDWAGRLIEAATGRGLDAWCAEHIFSPLGMEDTGFFLDAARSARKAEVCAKGADGRFAAIPFGLPAQRHFMMGGAGLYGTAADYLKFLAALASGGAPLLEPATFALMMDNHTGALDAGAIKSAQPAMSRDFEPLAGSTRRHGLAGLINLDPVHGGRSAGSLAWAGIANCYYWADPAAGAAGLLFAQILPFADPDIIATFEEVERAVYA